MIIECIVAGTNADGEPDLWFVKVECSEEQYSDGYHYTIAAAHALNHDYEEPFVVFDANDSAGRAMLPLFDWDTADIVEAL